jgi:hypothetical protein
MTDFGSGPTLKEASSWLHDDDARIEQILTVTEINSVVEGLPPFQDETRERIRQRLSGLSAPSPGPQK